MSAPLPARRTEAQMLEELLCTAREDARIRAVLLEGSRTDATVQPDLLQDFDIAYIVQETASFRRDRSWIDRFGQRLFMQYPDEGPFADGDPEQCYGWLMQFSDGWRLDLHVMTPAYALEHDFHESLCRVLLDKDGLFPPHAASSDRDFWVQRPDEAVFQAVCNEFWWCLGNVAKGLRRGNWSYAQQMLGTHVRPQLLQLLSWKAGAAHGWRVSAGKAGGKLPGLLPPGDWARYLASFSGCGLELEQAVDGMAVFFLELEEELAARLGFRWDRSEAEGSLGWLRHVARLECI